MGIGAHHNRGRLVRSTLFGAICGALVVLGVGLPATSAVAETNPPPGTPPTVSAAALPTWQINGVVWAQVVVGNTVYVTGSFTQARAPQGQPGSMSANNIFAYDIRTGNPTGFSHSLNAQGNSIAASPDGSRVYVGGDFTSVDGQARGHLAAFDTATGALVSGFAPSLSSRVSAIVATNDTVYVGGSFFNANGNFRSQLAAFRSSNGGLTSWAPVASGGAVAAMTLTPDKSRLIVGGQLTTLNGVSAYGMGSVDATSGATQPWAANQTIRDAAPNGGITTLVSDGSQVYGGGYAFGSGSSFEGQFAADPLTGNINWLNDCHGDTYSVFPSGQALYNVGHTHTCEWIGAFKNTNPWTFHHAYATTTYPTHQNTGPDDYGWNYAGKPASSLLQWWPDMGIGSYTGQYQAGWSITGNSNYVVIGGEFPSVNGKPQQGLTRFQTGATAPNLAPVWSSTITPTAYSPSAGVVRVAWQATWDRDDSELTYNLTRDGQLIYTTKLTSTFWQLPSMGFLDKNLSPGSTHTYRIQVVDPYGNKVGSNTSNQVTVSSAALSSYAQAVQADGAEHYWRLGETTGSVGYDSAGFSDLSESAGVGHGAVGAIQGDPDLASTFSGGNTGLASTSAAVPGPNVFSLEAWVRTSTNKGGKIIGFGNRQSGNSSNYDRHLYMDNAGHIIFGVYNNATFTATSSGTYSDNEWHYVVGTLSSSGLALYVDGQKVASNTATTQAQPFDGYWRIGGDNLNAWPSKPSSNYFNGTVDDVAVYPTALTPAQVQQHFVKGGGDGTGLPPVAAITTPTCTDLTCTFDASGSTGSNLTYSWDFGDGSSGAGVTTSHPYVAPGTYTVTLTVADDHGGSSTASVQVSPIAPPAAPVASIKNPTCTHLECEFDGSDSTGSNITYSWNFGDTPPGTSTDAKPTYTYHAAGTYTVTLTVNDDHHQSSSATVQVIVTAPPPAAPVADAGSPVCAGLTCDFDGSGSTGSNLSYSWDFGDTHSGTGKTTSNTYAGTGTYTVTLTVTGDGGSDTDSVDVHVTAPPPAGVLAADAFARTVATGWGQADTGGAWNPLGSANPFAVAGGTGQIKMSSPGSGPSIYLTGVSSDSTDLSVSVALDKAPTGGGVYVSVFGRQIAGQGGYFAHVRLMANGNVVLTPYRQLNGSESSLGGSVTVPGVTAAADTPLWVRIQVSGTSPTTVRAKVWPVGQAEPGAWQVSATDSTAALQDKGRIGLKAYLSGSATNQPLVARFDDLDAKAGN